MKRLRNRLIVQGCFALLVMALAHSANAAASTAITTVTLNKLTGPSCTTAPVTFGQPFRPGDVPAGATVQAELQGEALPTQMDVKARNEDGSVRHAVITIDAPCNSGAAVALVRRDQASQSSGAPVALKDVLATAFNATLEEDIAGRSWKADARALLQRAEAGGCSTGKFYCRKWLSGPLVSEWVVGAPLQAANQAHPHLAGYFAVRAYGPAPVKTVRVDIVSENDWAYQADPQNLLYDAHLSVAGGKHVDFDGLKQYRQSRWHQVMWWGTSQGAPLYAALDAGYLQSTPAVPSYAGVKLASGLAKTVRHACTPMDSCDISKHMEITGAQAQIGPLPRWSSAFVVDPNYAMFQWMLANSDALGGYAVHYRDQSTGEVLSLKSHPCATTLWPARTPNCAAAPHGDDQFPACKGDCKTPLHPDEAHHPAPSYVAYLATGDWYYASEMAFWADWVVFWQNPDYRDYATGLVNRTQLRGQAWALRSLADAAYLLPDDAPLKTYFNQVVKANIDWYNQQYTHNPEANDLGAISNYHAVIYPVHGHPRTGIATWQQSFFTWATGNLADMGFDGANALRDWASRFQIGQMTAPGYCWELASAYAVQIRPTRSGSFYKNFGQVYANSFPELSDAGCDADALNRKLTKTEGKKRFHYPPETMVGYPTSDTGFVANFQVGLAAAADANNPDASKAWSIFDSRQSKADYAWSPQFGITPTPSSKQP